MKSATYMKDTQLKTLEHNLNEEIHMLKNMLQTKENENTKLRNKINSNDENIKRLNENISKLQQNKT